MRAALPANESERLAALESYNLLDTSAELCYDRITRTARQVFQAPICLITLVDGTRQFFKSKIGLDISETPRDQAFCAHGLLQEETLVVPNALEDVRFADNPLVTGDPNVRFYVGAQLKARNRIKLGSLCVIDTEPRPHPSAADVCILEDLAAQVVELMEAGKGRREINGLRTDLDGARKTLQSDQKRRKKMEQTAALALAAGKLGFWEFDERTKRTQWSERMYDIMGFEVASDPPSVEGWVERVHPDDRMAVLTAHQEVERAGGSFTIKYRIRHPDATEHWVTTVGECQFDDQGEWTGMVGVSRDSSEADRKEQALAESEELFRVLSSSCPIGIVRTDADCSVRYANPRTAEIWQMPVEELRFTGWTSRVHPDDRAGFVETWAEQTRQGRSYEREYRLLMEDGSIRWVYGRSAVVLNQSNEPVGTVCTVDDITEQKEMLQELRAARDAAELANRSKDLFLSNVSHELRTPLNGILGMAELLLDTNLDEEQRQMAQIVGDSGRSLLTVVNDILDLSRIQASKMPIENAAFDWNLLVDQVMALMKPEAVKKGIALDLEQPAHMISKFIGDANRIKQILVVYLTNALKFTPAGSITLTVSAQAAAGNTAELLVMVRDTGPGIKAEDQPKLFRAFSQIDPSSTRRHGGVGLGLAIAQRLAELMGGSVGVISSAGEGATFWLRLTLRMPAEVELRSGIRPKPKQVHAGKRVLVVEDNLENQHVAINMLSKLGCQSDLATGGVMALEMISLNEYAMVLMDCQMPDLDGYGATKEIRSWERGQNRPGVPIIALTALAMNGDRERCLDAGMNDCLAKPIGLEELRRALDRWSGERPTSEPVSNTQGTMLA